MFLMQNCSKKRPNGIVMGRVFNELVLEMIEFEVIKTQGDINQAFNEISKITRPVFICNGEQFDFDDDQGRIRNLFHDFLFFETPDK